MKNLLSLPLLSMSICHAMTAVAAEDAQSSAPYEFRLHNATDVPLYMITARFPSGLQTWKALGPGACSEYRAVESAHTQIAVTTQNTAGERYELFFRDPGGRRLEQGRYTYSLDTVADNFPRRLAGTFFQEGPRSSANTATGNPCPTAENR